MRKLRLAVLARRSVTSRAGLLKVRPETGQVRRALRSTMESSIDYLIASDADVRAYRHRDRAGHQLINCRTSATMRDTRAVSARINQKSARQGARISAAASAAEPTFSLRS